VSVAEAETSDFKCTVSSLEAANSFR